MSTTNPTKHCDICTTDSTDVDVHTYRPTSETASPRDAFNACDPCAEVFLRQAPVNRKGGVYEGPDGNVVLKKGYKSDLPGLWHVIDHPSQHESGQTHFWLDVSAPRDGVSIWIHDSRGRKDGICLKLADLWPDTNPRMLV